MPQVVIESQNAYTVGGTTLVAGLVWLTDTGLSRKAAAEKARGEFRETGFDSYALHQFAKTWQYGLCASADATKKSSVYAAAAMLAIAAKAHAYPATWAGAFDIGNGMAQWVMVRDSAITPQGDMIVTHEVAAEYLESAAREGIELRVSDCVPTNSRASIESLLGSRPRGVDQVRLMRPGDKAARSVKLWVLPVGAILMLALGGGAWYWLDAQEQEANRLAAEAAKRATKASAKAAVQLVKAPTPWTQQPSAAARVGACIETYAQFVSRPAGWTATSASCEGSNLAVTFTRSPTAGTIADLLTAVPGAVPNNTGTTATYVAAIPESSADTRPLLPAADAARELISALQAINVRYSVDAAALPALPPLPSGQQYEPAGWKQSKVALIASRLQSGSMLRATDLPGLRATKISITSEQGVSFEGTLYVR